LVVGNAEGYIFEKQVITKRFGKILHLQVTDHIFSW